MTREELNKHYSDNYVTLDHEWIVTVSCNWISIAYI
jgi:hypothetical protein